jgi:hypothetical protein
MRALSFWHEDICNVVVFFAVERCNGEWWYL